MEPPAVVEHLDVLEQRLPGLLVGLLGPMVDEFALERGVIYLH
jgi:hypothetical protein